MSSVVVFDLDGLSIRTAGCYGNVETDTPLLNEFAAQSRVFEQHYRAFVDPTIERAHACESLLEAMGGSGLKLNNCPEDADSDAILFADTAGLAEQLEQHVDSEGMLAWVRLTTDRGDPPADVPLGLIAGLVEAGVAVAVTSACPLPGETQNSLLNEEAIRTPLMVWSRRPARVQSVTTSEQLIDCITGREPGDAAVIASADMFGLREPDMLLVAHRTLLDELSDTPDEQLDVALNASDERLQMFRKPDDVWNVHNVLAEAPGRAHELLVALRASL